MIYSVTAEVHIFLIKLFMDMVTAVNIFRCKFIFQIRLDEQLSTINE